jgi:signal transduction histidine kinase
MSHAPRHRILLVDDNPAIHADYRKILAPPASGDAALASAHSALFGEPPAAGAPASLALDIDSAHQGREALELVSRALAEGRPYALAFVDMRMPPGWDGARTLSEMCKVDPALQVVVCTAFSDQAWEQVRAQVGANDRLLIFKKPFDPIEVQQLAISLTAKWDIAQQARGQMQQLEALVERRTRDLAEANAELEQRCVDAQATTQRLARALSELSSAHELAKGATRAKSEFLANISHEIRTPMTAILGYADLMREASLPYEQKLEYLSAIRRNGACLMEIINDLLDISRIEAGRMTLELARCAPMSVLAQVASGMRARAGEKKLAFELACDGPLPAEIRTDARRLRQVLLNLVGNAVKFTERGSVRVVVATDVAGERLRVDVIDTGLGIAPERQSALFQPFVQGDGSLTREHGGTGLGLSISKRLAQMLGGDIEFESAPGRGSRFTLTIATGPLAGVRMITAASEAVVAAEVAASNESVRLDGLRVLLAEDGRDNQLLISFHLRKAGAQVTIEPNGVRALATALAAWRGSLPYDVILTDMQMPELDGYEVTRRLRELGYTAPIVALTAHALEGDRQTCLDAGCNEYLSKPVEREALVRVCRAVVAAARSDAA